MMSSRPVNADAYEREWPRASAHTAVGRFTRIALQMLALCVKRARDF
jgi:hypothetical protein